MSAPGTWHPQRLDDPRLPELPGTTPVTVVLVAGTAARAETWAARAAGAMARQWARSGLPTYLCDLALEAPELHEAFRVTNGEGVTDLVLYGASPRRVAQPVAEGLFLASAGTVVPDPGAVRASPRWDALVDAFQEAGALLLLYVPAGVPGLDAVLARADGVVELRGEDELLELGEARARVLASFGPGDDARDAPTAPDGPTGGRGDAEVREPQRVGAQEPPSAPKAEKAAAAAKGRGCLRWLIMVLVLLALVLVLVAAMGWIRLPGLGPEAASATLVEVPAASPQEEGSPTAPEVPEVQQVEAPLQAWALALEAHRDGATAAARVKELEARWPDLLFWVAPVRVDDRRFYRVLAGPATTSDEVEAVRARLGGSASWIPRRVGLGFRLGEMPELEAARTWAGVLAELGIPTHILAVPAAGGGRSFQIYAGGYASKEEAAEMAEILRAQDLGTAPLTERRGTQPA